MLPTFAWLLAGALAILLVLLASPMSLVVDLEWAERRRTRWRLRWLFGLIDVERDTGRRPARAARPPRPPARRRTTARPTARRGGAVGLAVVRTDAFVRRAARLLRDVGRAVALDDLRVRVAFGLDDPADTGRVWGLVAPLCVAAQAAGLDVALRPRFLEPGVDGACRGRLRVRPLTLVGLLAVFLCAPTTLRAIRAACGTGR